MKAYWGWRYSSTQSLTSALDEDEWSASRPSRFTPGEKAPRTHWIGGWVGPGAVLDVVVKRKIPSPRRKSNPRTPIVQPVAHATNNPTQFFFAWVRQLGEAKQWVLQCCVYLNTPIQWVPGALSLGIKLPGREADHSPPSSAEVKEWVELYFHYPNTPSWRGAQLKPRGNFYPLHHCNAATHSLSPWHKVLFSYSPFRISKLRAWVQKFLNWVGNEINNNKH
jgi:hypothetical protein